MDQSVIMPTHHKDRYLNFHLNINCPRISKELSGFVSELRQVSEGNLERINFTVKNIRAAQYKQL